LPNKAFDPIHEVRVWLAPLPLRSYNHYQPPPFRHHSCHLAKCIQFQNIIGRKRGDRLIEAAAAEGKRLCSAAHQRHIYPGSAQPARGLPSHARRKIDPDRLIASLFE
jgi:hypothetical protein